MGAGKLCVTRSACSLPCCTPPRWVAGGPRSPRLSCFESSYIIARTTLSSLPSHGINYESSRCFPLIHPFIHPILPLCLFYTDPFSTASIAYRSDSITVIMRSLLGLSLLPLLASASPVLNVGTIHNDAAPILSSSTADEVPNSYIVVFKDHVNTLTAATHHDWVQNLHLSGENAKMELRKRSQIPIATDIFQGLKHTYGIAGSLLGYSGHFDDDVIEQVRRHPDVRSRNAFLLERLLCKIPITTSTLLIFLISDT